VATDYKQYCQDAGSETEGSE